MPSDTYTLTISDLGVPSPHGSTHLSSGSDPIADATGSVAGLMSAASFTKLDSVIVSAAANTVLGNGTGTTAAITALATTGTGSIVRASGATLTAPILGTPALGSVLTNCTGLVLTSGTGVTGILPVANGGTGYNADGVSVFKFNTTPVTTAVNTGELSWNVNDSTLDLKLNGGVTLQVGQETNLKVQASVAITNGQVVYINGGTGILPTVLLADYSTIDAKKTLGVATQDISSGGTGYITLIGLVRDLNLTTLLGSPIANGDTVWLGASGALTKTEPPYPNAKVRIGHIVNATNVTGIIHVNVNFDPTGTVNGTGKIGYGAGSGGTVTQITSKSVPVLLNKTTGQITMHNAVLNHDTIVSFTLNNNKIEAGDVLILNHISGGTAGIYLLNAQCASGSATINVKNTHISAGVGNANNLGESIVIAFAVIKAVTA